MFFDFVMTNFILVDIHTQIDCGKFRDFLLIYFHFMFNAIFQHSADLLIIDLLLLLVQLSTFINKRTQKRKKENHLQSSLPSGKKPAMLLFHKFCYNQTQILAYSGAKLHFTWDKDKIIGLNYWVELLGNNWVELFTV